MADDVIVIDVHVSYFSREARFSEIELAVEDDTDADAPADVHEDDVSQSLADAFQIFTVSHAAGIVVDAERQVESFGQCFCQWHFCAGKIIIGTSYLRIHSSTDTHASLFD